MKLSDLLRPPEGLSVVKAELLLVPAEDTTLPPMSSRVLKSLALREQCLGSQLSRAALFRLSMLRDQRGSPIYSTHSTGRPRVARQGEPLRGYVSILTASDPSQLLQCSGRARPFDDGPPFEYQVTSLSVAQLDMLRLGLGEGLNLRLSFLTPTAIPAMIMNPPWAKARGKPIAGTRGYRLFPEPSYIVAYSVGLWLMAVGRRREAGYAPYYLGRLGDLRMIEVNYSVRPVTALVGTDDRGHMRLMRGFVGWAEYALTSKAVERFDGPLALAQEMGIGKLRSMGMGEVRAEVLQAPKFRPGGKRSNDQRRS
ncbi:CRISPR system precrRNA processing endoribonuclease RAMP protein Cas6 [Acidilobus sp.]|uniref:CRISPR system precrRNA processing endoribonuclease RAMP protein Cas6 n=1 Tax=Acidilobus sp. TaxID=1872109 RepID=UPI003CFDBC5D